MTKLDADMKAIIRRTMLCFAATINADGSPNLSPKSTLRVHDDDHLLFADIASPGTVANLRHDPRIEINCVDIFARQMESRFVFFQGHPEYDGLSLQREYMRDLARFLGRERNDYPAIPAGYFDAVTEARLASFESRARTKREPTLAAELPGLTLRPDVPSGAAARLIFRNWLDFLGQGAKAALPAR